MCGDHLINSIFYVVLDLLLLQYRTGKAVYFLWHSPVLIIYTPGVKTTFLESSHRAEGANVDSFFLFFFWSHYTRMEENHV